MNPMHVLDPKESEKWMLAAVAVAGKATCRRGRGGAVVVADGEIIGRGYTAPPIDDERYRKCHLVMPRYPKMKQKSDRTCCVHAEWRAILDALGHHQDRVAGSRLFYTGVDDEGAMRMSGLPYCTVCSRLALETGIAEFVLWHETGITAYPTDEYNDLSYQFLEDQEEGIRGER